MDLDDLIRQTPPITLEQMLDARERRAERQREYLSRPQPGTPAGAPARALISFTLNLPGERKAYPLAVRAFHEGGRSLDARLPRNRLSVVLREEFLLPTGPEGYWLLQADAPDTGAAWLDRVKALTLAIEESHPLGRLWDLDVIPPTGRPLKGEERGRAERPCLICGKPVWECARSRAHAAEELARRAAGLIRDYFDGSFADQVAELATRALLYEVNTTPKPGLVDRDNQGAHRDMDIFTFIDSAVVLTPFFREVTLLALRHRGEAETLLPLLRYPGQRAEERMFAATGGVNTHKGLIFSLGIVCAGLGVMRAGNLPNTVDSLLDLCARIAGAAPQELTHGDGGTDKETSLPEEDDSNGRRAFRRYGVTGVRGEAAGGFPHLRRQGYPALCRAVAQGHSLNDAGVAALLHIICAVDDTNLLSRSDYATMKGVQRDIGAFLAGNPDLPALLAYAENLNRRFCEKNLSPGGSADLLVLAFMLFFLGREGVLTSLTPWSTATSPHAVNASPTGKTAP